MFRQRKTAYYFVFFTYCRDRDKDEDITCYIFFSQEQVILKSAYYLSFDEKSTPCVYVKRYRIKSRKSFKYRDRIKEVQNCANKSRYYSTTSILNSINVN